MARQFEIVFHGGGAVVAAELLEDAAPITCENFWNAIAKPHTDTLHHGAEGSCQAPCQ